MTTELENSAVGPATNRGGPDPMARAQDVPDVANLLAELEYAQQNALDNPANIAIKEAVRYARWEGQTPDGLKHREQMGDDAQPYDRAPDTRIMLADDVVNTLVDVVFAAFVNSSPKVAPSTARQMDMAEAAELREVVNWMRNGPLYAQLFRQVEFAAQVMFTIGYCVLHPNWRRQKLVRNVELTMAQITAIAQRAQYAGQPGTPNPLAAAPEMIADPQQEESAAELLMMFFDDLSLPDARRAVRELRKDGATQVQVSTRGPSTPELSVLVPGQHFFLPPESTAFPERARWMAVRVFLTEANLRERAQEEEWNEAFVEEALKQKGMSIDNQTTESEMDENMKDVEIFYMYQQRVNDEGVPGMWCTIVNAFVRPEAGRPSPKSTYGRHWLVDLGHDKYPAVIAQTEVTGLRPFDARGVPEQLNTQQREVKNARDGLTILQQLTITPPLKRRGTAASKLPPEFGPLAQFTDNTGSDWTWFNPPNGNPELAFKLGELVKVETADRFGIPRKDGMAMLWQLRHLRLGTQWLAAWSEVFWMLAILAYKNLTPEELQNLLGRPPLLSAEKVAQYQLCFWYDTRAGDGEWIDRLVGWVTKILATGGATGMNLERLLNLILRYIDPGIYEEVATDPGANKTKVFKDVRDEINNVMLGNKPQLVEKDPTAPLKLAYARAIVDGNKEFKARITPGNQFFNQDVADNFATMMKNLQHSYQETVLSKQQGRLGVADIGGQAQ